MMHVVAFVLLGQIAPSLDKDWADFVRQQGVAVFLVVFVVLTGMPAIGWAAWKVGVWWSEQLKRLVDGHLTFLTVVSGSNDRTAAATEKIQELMSAQEQSSAANNFKLDEIHEGVRDIREQVKEIHQSWHERQGGKPRLRGD